MMPTQDTSPDRREQLSRADAMAVLGEIGDDTFAEILRVEPTLADLEQAMVWLRGEGDVLDRSGHPLTGKAARIYEIVTAAEDDEATH